MKTHTLHYIPEQALHGHVPAETCVCSPELLGDGSYMHRRTYDFGWTYPCCGSAGEGRVYGGQSGPTNDTLAAYVDALPHNCCG